MKVQRVVASEAQLIDPQSEVWQSVSGKAIPMFATPLANNPMIEKVSPFLAKSTDHGSIAKLNTRAAHNGRHIGIWMSWSSAAHKTLDDLDEFVDGVAVMFPLAPGASAFTMGAPGKPVNAWYWKANLGSEAFDVVAEGYGTSARRPRQKSTVKCGAHHGDGKWYVSLIRAIEVDGPHALLEPGRPVQLAFACWDGGNRERAGRKSFSGDFVAVEVEA